MRIGKGHFRPSKSSHKNFIRGEQILESRKCTISVSDLQVDDLELAILSKQSVMLEGDYSCFCYYRYKNKLIVALQAPLYSKLFHFHILINLE